MNFFVNLWKGVLFNYSIFVNRRIELQSCNIITGKAIEYLAKRCQKLEYLNCCFCKNVTDNELAVFAFAIPALKYLNIGYNPSVSIGGVRFFLTASECLEELFCIECANIAPADIDQLRIDFPKTNINRPRIMK